QRRSAGSGRCATGAEGARPRREDCAATQQFLWIWPGGDERRHRRSLCGIRAASRRCGDSRTAAVLRDGGSVMCAPSIIEEVRREISRRGFLIGAGAALGLAASVVDEAHAQAKPIRLARGFRDVLDLTHTLSPSTPVFPAFKPLRMTERFSI